MRTVTTDVLIVGSGFGAAAPALRLSRAGFRVLVVEKGPALDPDRDFRQTQDPQYVRRYLKSLPGEGLNVTYAEALGGGSGFYEMVSLRAPSIVFEQRDRKGRRLWPEGLSRTALDPYYAVAEEMLHVEQIAPEDVPKTGLAFALLMKNLGYSCDRARYAVRGCIGSSYCVTGCIFGAKQSLLLNYIPQAKEAGARFECGLEAETIRTLVEIRNRPADGPLESVPHRYEVVCQPVGDRDRDREGEREGAAGLRVRARLVILAGGTVGTATLLLRSREHLKLMSRHVGRNIAFNGSVKAVGMLPDGFPDGDLFVGRTHPGMISYEFLESMGITISAAKPLPIQLVAGARLSARDRDRRFDYWGEPNVELMKVARRRMMILYAIGLTPPAARLEWSDGDEKPRLVADIGSELEGYHHRTERLLESILSRNGCTLLNAEMLDPEGVPYPDLHFFTSHQMGSCRMADSADRGVCDTKGEVFGYPGLYVSDGAAIPSSLAVNSSLTILANAERIALGIVARHGATSVASASATAPAP